jgi:hypothetical protein
MLRVIRLPHMPALQTALGLMLCPIAAPMSGSCIATIARADERLQMIKGDAA